MVEPGSDDFVEENGHGEGKRGCCSWWNFEGVAPAQGFCRVRIFVFNSINTVICQYMNCYFYHARII